MELKDAIIGRRSIRQFEKRSVEDVKTREILEAGRWAPSAGNLQSRYFYVVKDEKVKDMIADAAYGQRFVAGAGVVIVVCADLRIKNRYGKRGEKLYSLLDCGAAIQNMLLRAYDLGLGGVWVGAFDEEKLKEILDVPNYLRPVSIISIGYPAEEPTPPERKKIEEVSTIV